MPVTRLTLLTNPDKCNLHCPLCFLNQRGSCFGMGEMPFKIAKAAVLKYAETLKEVIPSTMGEPLLYSHFEKLLLLCKSLNIPLNITTNGSLLNDEALSKILGNTEIANGDVAKNKSPLQRLLESCSDIKISCMGFSVQTMSVMMPGLDFGSWKNNVKATVAMRDSLCKNGEYSSTVSLQVTLHRNNADEACDILAFAETLGIDRIKWNLPFFLNGAPEKLLDFSLSKDQVERLQKALCSKTVKCEGNLFSHFSNDFKTFKTRELAGQNVCARFANELWILPDGSEEHCPNPERRFGNAQSNAASCAKCPMR